MGKREDEFLKKLLTTFQIEAEEHVRTLSSGLIELERAPADAGKKALVESLFREAHSLKGAARAVNLTGIEAICQSLESVFSAWKREEVTPSPALFDLIHQAVDRVEDLLASPEAAPTSAESSQLRALLQRMQEAAKRAPSQSERERSEVARAEGAGQPESADAGPTEPVVDLHPPVLAEHGTKGIGQPESVGILSPETLGNPPATVDARSAPGDTVRISAARLDALLHQVEELLSVKLSAGQRAIEARTITTDVAARERQWARIRPDLRALQQSLERGGQGSGKETLGKLVEFAEGVDGFLRSLEAQLVAFATAAQRDDHALGSMVGTLLSDIKQVLMLPFSSLLDIVPKLVRDLSRDRGKDVEVVIRGGEIEIDRRILEELKDPLIHLVRNSIDHGIEQPEDRTRKRKPSRGTITVVVSQKDGGKVGLSVADDGGGIDVASVKAAAARCGVVAREEADWLAEQDAASLIFRSGVSTSPIITDLSGRGLGLAIVQEKVEKLGGTVSVEAKRDVGTTFRITLPLTIATFRGVLVRVNDQAYAIPTASVERVLRVRGDEVKTVENREAVELNGRALALVRLGDVLELPRPAGEDEYGKMVHMLVIASAEEHIALRVDEILNEQDVLVKPLGRQLSRVRNVAGVTVLGTGKVVPILNVSDLLKSAAKVGSSGSMLAALPAKREEVESKSVLVVEDSITARTLLKNILESAGYDVRTAIDGVDGLTQLRTGRFGLVISDVDMPRMNGFDLTASIRADKKLAQIPIVLVTALASREDRERGIDVGADAYIVKSGFDQGNLLQVIRGLI